MVCSVIVAIVGSNRDECYGLVQEVSNPKEFIEDLAHFLVPFAERN